MCSEAAGGGRYAVTKFRRAVSINKTVENNKRFDIAVGFERLKTVSRRRGVKKLLT